ncbi:unnamed protein product, partial [Prorocentrum cordatum]
ALRAVCLPVDVRFAPVLPGCKVAEAEGALDPVDNLPQEVNASIEWARENRAPAKVRCAGAAGALVGMRWPLERHIENRSPKRGAVLIERAALLERSAAECEAGEKALGADGIFV